MKKRKKRNGKRIEKRKEGRGKGRKKLEEDKKKALDRIEPVSTDTLRGNSRYAYNSKGVIDHYSEGAWGEHWTYSYILSSNIPEPCCYRVSVVQLQLTFTVIEGFVKRLLHKQSDTPYIVQIIHHESSGTCKFLQT